MTTNERPVRVLLAMADAARRQELRAHAFHMPEVEIDLDAPTVEAVEVLIPTSAVEVVLLDDAIFPAGWDHRKAADFIHKHMRDKAVIVLLDPHRAAWAGPLRELDYVADVVEKPVNPVELLKKAHAAGVTARARRHSLAPQESVTGTGAGFSPATMRAVGTNVIAFASGKGGTGKTTLAVNTAYRLAQMGVFTALIGFDIPDAIGAHLNLPAQPNSIAYYRNPSREGFAASLIPYKVGGQDLLHVIQAPATLAEVEALNVAERAPEDAGSIASLLYTARTYHPAYGAIIVDLPPLHTEWSVQPLMAVNAVVMVVNPSFVDVQQVIHFLHLITEFEPRYRIPRTAVYLAVNMVVRGDNITASDIRDAIREKLGWAPQVIASVPFNHNVRLRQNRGQVPVAHDDCADVRKGIDALLSQFYGDLVRSPQNGRRGRSWLPSIRIT